MIKGIVYEEEKRKRAFYTEQNNLKRNDWYYYDTLALPTLFGEIWLPVTQSVVPNVAPFYYVSNLGRVYSTQYKNGVGGLRQFEADKSGYISTAFVTMSREYVSVRIHRLVMETFCPIHSPEQTIVNHINGIKDDNRLVNLEWCTPQKNVQHAYQNGLIPHMVGEINHNSKHTEDEVRIICEGLEKGLSIVDTCKYAGLEVTKANRKYVSRIKRKDLWTHISNQYNIPEESYGNRTISDEDIHKICLELQNGLTPIEVVDKLWPNLEAKERYKKSNNVNKIKRRESHVDISRFYYI